MACIKAAITSIGLNALGGSLGGLGLGNLGSALASPMSALGGIAGQMGITSQLGSFLSPITSALGGVTDLVSAGLNPLTSISGALNGIAGGIGSALSDGLGSITGVLGEGFSALGGTGILDSISSHTSNLMGSFGANSIMQAFSGVEAFSNISGTLASSLTSGLSAQFGSAFSALTSALPFGDVLSGLDADFLDALDPGELTDILGGGEFDFGNFLGDAIGSIGDVVTNGMTSFISGQVNDILPDFAQDLVNLGGAFDLGDIANFGNPGQLVEKLINSGAGEITGIFDVLQDVAGNELLDNIGNLASGQFNDILNDALGMVTNPDMLNIAQDVLGSKIPGLESLADFTNLAKVLPTSFDFISPDTFQQFAGELANVSLGSLATPKQFGKLLQAFDIPTELPIIGNALNLIDKDAAANITSKFLGGTGLDGRLQISDVMGSLAGVGLKEPINQFTNSMRKMEDLGAFTNLNNLYSHLSNGLTGNFTTGGGSPVYGVDGIVDTVLGITHEDMDSFAKKTLDSIQSEVTSIANNSTWSGAFGSARSAIQQIQKKIYDEKIVHLPKMDLHLNLRTNDPQNVFGFVASMENRVTNPDAVAMLKGLAEGAKVTGDKFGSYWDAFTSEMINRNAVQEYAIEWMAEDKIELVA